MFGHSRGTFMWSLSWWRVDLLQLSSVVLAGLRLRFKFQFKLQLHLIWSFLYFSRQFHHCHHVVILMMLCMVLINDKDYSFVGSVSFISSDDDRCHAYNEQVQIGMNEVSALCLYSAKPTCSYHHSFSESTDWSSCMSHRVHA